MLPFPNVPRLLPANRSHKIISRTTPYETRPHDKQHHIIDADNVFLENIVETKPRIARFRFDDVSSAARIHQRPNTPSTPHTTPHIYSASKSRKHLLHFAWEGGNSIVQPRRFLRQVTVHEAAHVERIFGRRNSKPRGLLGSTTLRCSADSLRARGRRGKASLGTTRTSCRVKIIFCRRQRRGNARTSGTSPRIEKFWTIRRDTETHPEHRGPTSSPFSKKYHEYQFSVNSIRNELASPSPPSPPPPPYTPHPRHRSYVCTPAPCSAPTLTTRSTPAPPPRPTLPLKKSELQQIKLLFS